MPRKLLVLISIISMLTIAFPAAAATPDIRLGANVRMRIGPGKGFQEMTTLSRGTDLFAEARNSDASWLLVHTENKSARGWITNIKLIFAPGFAALRLPFSQG